MTLDQGRAPAAGAAIAIHAAVGGRGSGQAYVKDSTTNAAGDATPEIGAPRIYRRSAFAGIVGGEKRNGKVWFTEGTR